MLLCTTEHPHSTFLTICLIQNLMLKCLNFFPLPDYYLMISETRYSWCNVPVFGIPLCSWVSAGGQYGNFPPPRNWDQEWKMYRKLEVSSLIDLILAMTILFSDMTLTLHKSRVRCCCAMQFWAYSSLMPAPLPAGAGCETSVWIIIKLTFIA